MLCGCEARAGRVQACMSAQQLLLRRGGGVVELPTCDPSVEICVQTFTVAVGVVV